MQNAMTRRLKREGQRLRQVPYQVTRYRPVIRWKPGVARPPEFATWEADYETTYLRKAEAVSKAKGKWYARAASAIECIAIRKEVTYFSTVEEVRLK